MRSLGLGGAYVGVAEGIEGASFNPAAAAVRQPYSITSFDYDLTASVSFPGAFAGTDFENRGTNAPKNSVYDNFYIVNLGGVLQAGPWGLAVGADIENFRVTGLSNGPVDLSCFVDSNPGKDDGTCMQIIRYHVDLAHGFLNDQLSVGIGVRAVTMLFSQAGHPAGSLLAMNGLSPQAGVLIRPDGQRFRIGASFRGPVYGPRQGGQTAFDAQGKAYITPDQIVLPAEIEAGAAVQIGPRPLNPRWQSPAEQEEPMLLRIEEARAAREKKITDELASASVETREAKRRALQAEEDAIRAVEDARLEAGQAALKEARRARFENMPRARIMVLASVLAIAGSDNSVAVSSFVSQTNEPYGGSWTLTPRFGVESEPVTDRLVVRVGGYLEPARFADATPRQHLTFGGPGKLFEFDFFGILPKSIWKLGLGVDLAPRYTNWGLGLGIWH